MVELTPNHPQLLGNLNPQYSISNGLFSLMLETATTRVQIGRTWIAISQDYIIGKINKSRISRV